MPTSYYLKLGLGDEQVLGDSSDPHHRGWIKLEAFSFGSSNSGAHGAGGGPEKTTISEINLTKGMDRASQTLQNATANGRPFKKAILEVADAKTGIPSLRIVLFDVLISSFASPSSSSRGRSAPTDALSLTFGSIELNHNPIPEDSVGAVLESLSRLVGRHPSP